MSDYAYNDPNPYGHDDFDQPERTSLAAVFGFILTLLCCLPLVPALGALLGIFGLIGISKSGGRVKGKGLAIAAIILGLLFTVAQIGIAIGARQVAGVMVNEIGGSVTTLLEDIERGNYDAARSSMTGEGGSATDGQIAAFRAAYQAEYGTFVSTPTGIGDLWSGYMTQGQAMQAFQGRNDIVPMPTTFSNSDALVVFKIDPTGGNGQQALPILDVGVISTFGTEIWLSDFEDVDPAAPDSDADDAPDVMPEDESP